MRRSLPFSVSKTENFFDRLGEYIGDVFYDMLPEHGYELRDEQIYMAYQLEQAFKHRGTIFAEAGVGTGKTFVYLLYAISYARYKGKPAIISCADETLIEQLVKEGGDIEKLEKALGLTVDVRLAKAREQYVCVKKLENLQTTDKDLQQVRKQIPSFVFEQGNSMQSFERYGDRKEYPWVSNEKWEKIAWDPLQQCSTCEWRHRSGQTLNREYYRHATDIIICSHDFYMEHVWTKDSRKREGQMPLLPEASSVVFDEGHLLEFAAQKALTYRFDAETLGTILTEYMSQDVREESLYVMEDILNLHNQWFEILTNSAKVIEGSSRKEVPRSEHMMTTANMLNEKVETLLEQLVFDSELFTIDGYHIKIIEEYLEFFSYGLSILLKEDQSIFWLEKNNADETFVIMPRLVEDVLEKQVFSQSMPFVFSSATLSQDGDFTYLANSLGIKSYDSCTVESPFNYQEQVRLIGHTVEDEFTKWQAIKKATMENGGSTLILFTSKQAMERFRWWNQSDQECKYIFEGDKEISQLVRQFQHDKSSVLCAYHLWEGLDVPGESLSQVIITDLPFPPNDPVFQAKRKHADHSINEVDVPYMLLRLKQGMGRLIRSNSDKGTIQIWVSKKQKDTYLEKLEQTSPTQIKWD